MNLCEKLLAFTYLFIIYVFCFRPEMESTAVFGRLPSLSDSASPVDAQVGWSKNNQRTTLKTVFLSLRKIGQKGSSKLE